MTEVPAHRSRLLLPSPRWRPDLRLRVAIAATGVVVAMAMVLSAAVASDLRKTAADAALHNVESIVRGYVDPVVYDDSLDLDGPRDPEIDTQLDRLVLAGDIRQINLISRDGSVAYSSNLVARGHRAPIGPDLATAFSGESLVQYVTGDQPRPPEPIVSLPDSYVEIFVPIRGSVDGDPIGVYQVFQDGRPIELRVATTRTGVFLIAIVAATLLLVLVWLAFAATSRRLSDQNRRLREQAAIEEQLAQDLRRSEERFRSVVRNSSDIILILRPDGTIAYESPAVSRVLGHAAGAGVGRSVLEGVHPDDRVRGEYLLTDVLKSPGAEATAEFRTQHADGSWRVLEAVAKNLVDEPGVDGIVVNYRDVTERAALEDQLRHQAFHDTLTGLPNRALFTDRLEHATARRARDRRAIAVLFVDLDDFKSVNDTLGHPAGDLVLRDVANRLRTALRPEDTIARMGGDEFAILLEDAADRSTSEVIASRILEAVGVPFAVGGHELRVHASVGIALAATEESADELLRNADLAMYLAKSEGKNRVVVYEPGQGDVALARLQLKADLHHALERNELRLVYQPIVQLDSATVTGFEALMRWEHPQRGSISPVEFIPLAEESGLIVGLGRWVLAVACREAQGWSAASAGRPLELSVNVSARQLEGQGLVGDVAAALAESGLPAGRLTLEITETVLMRDVPSTISTLTQLKALGVRLAIDDFGTGYSSLSYLRQFPIDMLKIDRSFVAVLGGGTAESAVVSSVLSLAATLRLQTVAEGIETTAQLDELLVLGARLGQGFLFDRPVETADVPGVIRGVTARVAPRTPPRRQPKQSSPGLRATGVAGPEPAT